MLKTRVATALVLLAIFIPVTWFAPPAAFGALIALVLVFAAWEWARLLRLARGGAIAYALIAAVLLAASLFDFGIDPASLYRVAAIFWIVAVPFAMLRKPVLASGPWRAFLLLAGLCLFLACWHALYAARQVSVGFVLSLLLVVWLADIGAYFAGKAFGRHKLAPTISPGKTWEGAFGGWILVLAVAAATLLSHATPTVMTALRERLGGSGAWLGLTVLVIFSVVGDLFESLLKRQAGVKDSSALLPGHGGVLDRVDALLPVLPLAMLLLG